VEHCPAVTPNRIHRDETLSVAAAEQRQMNRHVDLLGVVDRAAVAVARDPVPEQLVGVTRLGTLSGHGSRLLDGVIDLALDLPWLPARRHAEPKVTSSRTGSDSKEMRNVPESAS